MGTILEKATGTVLDTESDQIGIAVEQVAEQPIQAVGVNIMEFIKRPTGEGDVNEYINHPMNYDGTREVGQVIRGMTGLLGALNYAIIDIGIGLMKILSKKKAGGADGSN